MTKPSPAELVASVNAVLGEGVISLGDDPRFATKVLPTGVLPIDYLLMGGVPRNRWTEFYGDFSTLKSYVALKCIATTQQAGGTCALIDTEHSADQVWMESLGIDVSKLIIMHPDTGEKVVDATEVLVRANTDLVVWDSIAAMLPEEEQQKAESETKHQPARLAQLMSRATRKITACNSATAIIVVNQTRMQVGVTFGNPETTPGGKAMPFYASHRVNMRKAGSETEQVKVEHGGVKKNATRTTAYTIKASLLKSKLTKPFTDVFFRFDLTTGEVDEVRFLVDMGIDRGLILNTTGHTWTYLGESCRGKAKIAQMLVDNGLTESLKTELLTEHLPGADPPAKSKAVSRKRRSPKSGSSGSTR